MKRFKVWHLLVAVAAGMWFGTTPTGSGLVDKVKGMFKK